MIIKYIELNGYKRFRLNGDKHFKMVVTSPIQQILGTNGSGKSALFRELSPLPAEPNNYNKEGSKVIKLEHNGSNYTLTSSFSPKNEHSFIKDYVELNGGKTYREQLSLVKQEFKITPSVRDLQTGTIKFTGMGPTTRREWYTLLSDSNYDYALKVFSKLKDRSSDYTGALNTTKRRLVEEAAKVMTDEEVTKLRNEVTSLHYELNVLFENKSTFTDSSKQISQDVDFILQSIEALCTVILKKTITPVKGVTFDEVDSAILELKTQISTGIALIEEHTKYYRKLEEDAKLLKQAGLDGITSLQQSRLELQTKRSELFNNKHLRIEVTDPLNAYSAYTSVTDTLTSIFSELPENKDRRFSQAHLTELRNQVTIKKQAIFDNEGNMAKLQAKRNHLEEHKKSGQLICPSCTHRWIPGFDDNVLAETLFLITKYDTAHKVLTSDLLELEEKLTQFNQYVTNYRSYVTLTSQWKILTPLWDHILQKEWVTDNPRKILSILPIFEKDLHIDIQIEATEKELARINDLIIQTSKIENNNLTEVNDRIEQYSDLLSKLTTDQHRFKIRLDQLTTFKKDTEHLLFQKDQLQSLLVKVLKKQTLGIDTLRSELVNQCIRQCQSQLAVKEDILGQINIQKALVADLEFQVTDLQAKQEAAKILVKEMSPTEGLIADSLFGFIRNFNNQMNALIAKVWKYPLVIQECAMSDEGMVELDYKFPLLIEEVGNVVPDVANGSTAMCEIINLAFVVTALRSMGLGHAPMFLDEFSASFDEAHRSTAVELVKNLLDHYTFSQLFMISHYFSMSGAIVNAEICVLCENNITVPERTKYNQHVVIE